LRLCSVYVKEDMNAELKALNLLGIPVWLQRPATPISITELMPSHYPYVIYVNELQKDFSLAHQEQLQKILAYLNLTEYQFYYGDHNEDFSCNYLLSFGKLPESSFKIQNITQTYSISEMLSTPSCKRQVLQDVSPLKLS
jgi:hypothetical protein